ncbi:MAG: peptidoglycan-binding domain-containing protein [Desulfobacteraceae bacterium]
MAILFFNEQDKKQSSHTETTGQSHELDTQISVSSGLERSNVIFISNVGNNTTVHALGKAGADPYSFSGDYYLLMQKAVKAFQRKNGLTVDGKLGSNTWSRLRIEAGLAKPEPVHEPGDTWRELTPGTVFAGRCQMEKQLGQGGHG